MWKNVKYILKLYTYFFHLFLNFVIKASTEKALSCSLTLIFIYYYLCSEVFPTFPLALSFHSDHSLCQGYCTGSLYISNIIIPPFALIKYPSSVDLLPLHSQMRRPSVLSSSFCLWHSCHSVNKTKKEVFSTNCLKPLRSLSKPLRRQPLKPWLQLACVRGLEASWVCPTCTKSTAWFQCSQVRLELFFYDYD